MMIFMADLALLMKGETPVKDISELIGSKYPVIQGAMGVICNPEMVG